MRLVPEVPTDEMNVAGCEAMKGNWGAQDVYKAMLAAAPAASGDELAKRLLECAYEVEEFPHPSHCKHLHVAFKVMREAAAALCARSEVIEKAANIALAIDSGRGNEMEIAKAIRSLKS